MQKTNKTAISDGYLPSGDSRHNFSGYSLKLPMSPENVEMAADLAALRGRQDVADDLRTALKEAIERGDREEVLR